MIGYLTGKIISKKPTQLLLDVNGVGYLINITIPTFEKLGNEKEETSIHTYLHVKEDSLTLYGFSSEPEKKIFELLISISGIGPKLAQSILSGIQTAELIEAIRTANLNRIVAVPGIGKKTGERLIIELKDKVSSLASEEMESVAPAFTIMNDAVKALVNLGYNQKTAENSIRKILDGNPDATIEELIKDALSYLNK